MTSITPPINVPAWPGLSRDPRNAVPTSRDADPGFEILTVPARSLPAEGAPAGSMRADEAALRSAIAHVFNAYGFFSADQVEPSQREAPQVPVSTGGADVAAEKTQSATELPTEEEPYRPAHGPNSGLPPQASLSAAAVHEGALPPTPAPIGNRPTEESRAAQPFLRALENRLANEPELPEAGSAKAIASRQAHAEQRDRLTLKIADHSVELIARLSNLSEEEKQRLFDEVESLLAAHSLSLASATLNGTPFSQAIRSNT